MDQTSRNIAFHDSLELFAHVSQIADMILMNNDIEHTANTILDKLNKSLGSIFLIYFKVDYEDNNLNFFSFSHKISPKIYKIIQNLIFDPYAIKYPLNVKEPLIIQCANDNKIVTSKKLRDFFLPVFKWPMLLDKIQKALKIANSIAVPTVIQDKVVGVFFVTLKEESFNEQQLKLIKFYANILKIAFDNSQKYTELQRKYELEKEITATLSHELRTPLTVAYNYCYLVDKSIERLKQKGVRNIEEKDLEDLISKNAEAMAGIKRMDEVTSSIFQLHSLELEQHQNMKRYKIDLYVRLIDLMTFFQQKAIDKGLTFEYQLKLKENKLYGQGIQFEQILTILIDNALKYTMAGGITVEVREKQKKLYAKVVDTGIGIEADKRKMIFERFYRDREEKNKNLSNISGIGLGLYIANKLVQLLKGSISVSENPKGQGTQFEVEIPV